MVISAIGGTAGIGKTALAIRFAHQVVGRYPDGQLYVNLRGFDPASSPVAPGDALRGFLIALGVTAEAIPADAENQANLYRSMLAGKRVLVLLDNARDAAQVRPLLPGSPGCLVIVTSRSQLTGLIAAEGARPLTLDVLTSGEARSLLASRLGQQRLDSEADAAAEIIRLTAGLPLALAIVAGRAAARPQLALADLAAELRDARSRLDALSTGDPATDLREVFSWSWRQLGEPAARMFRLLGLHPGPSITAPAATSLATVPLPEARAQLAELARCNLLTEHAPGRYTLHDLLRAYAADLAAAPKEAGNSREAVGRLLDYYLSTAAAAMDLLYPAEAHRRPRVPPPAIGTPQLTDATAALAWLDAERPALIAVTAHAAAHGWPGHAVRMSATLTRYLEGGHYAEGVEIHSSASRAARQAGDQNGEADAERDLGAIYLRLGRYSEAYGSLQRALALYRRIGDRHGEARALNGLAVAEWQLGRTLAAIGHQEQALPLFRQAGDRVGESILLNNLGDALYRLGRHQEAAGHLRRSLALARRNGDRLGEAYALNNLGEAAQRAGEPRQAAERYEQAIAIFREMGQGGWEAEAFTCLGTVHASLGQYAQARECHQHALAMFRELGDSSGEATARNGLGEASLAAGCPEEAMPHHRAALDIGLDVGNREQQARAHAGLGYVYETLGRPTLASMPGS